MKKPPYGWLFHELRYICITKSKKISYISQDTALITAVPYLTYIHSIASGHRIVTIHSVSCVSFLYIFIYVSKI